MAEKKTTKTSTSKKSSLQSVSEKKSPILKKAAQKPVTRRDLVLGKGKVITELGESQVKDFVNFIRTQGVVGLAVGVVIGGAVTVLAKSLVDNVVMPPIGLLFGSTDGIKGLVWNLGRVRGGGIATLHYGAFLNDFINFLVVAFAIYFIVHIFRFDRLDKKKDDAK